MTRFLRLIGTACIATLLLAAPGATAFGVGGGLVGDLSATADHARLSGGGALGADADVPEIALPSLEPGVDPTATDEHVSVAASARASVVTPATPPAVPETPDPEADATVEDDGANASAEADVSFLDWLRARILGAMEMIRGVRADASAAADAGADLRVEKIANVGAAGDLAAGVASDLPELPEIPDAPESPAVPELSATSATRVVGALG